MKTISKRVEDAYQAEYSQFPLRYFGESELEMPIANPAV